MNRWRRLTLRSRLSLLAAAAVAVAVVGVSVLSWLVVRTELYRQLDGQLETDARTIAAQPERWRDTVQPPRIPDSDDDEHRPGRGPRQFHQQDFGPRWQLLDPAGVPYGAGTGVGVRPVLPVTEGARRVAVAGLPQHRERVGIGWDSYRMLTVRLPGGGAVQVAQATEPVNRTLGQLGALLAVGSLAGVAGAGLLGRSVARAGLAPVERLTRAVEHVAVTKDLQAAIPVDGEDEVARLARSFNAMLGALDASRTAQRMLVEDAGHELRTPLTSLRTNIELLVRAEATPGRTLSADDRSRLLRDLEVQVVELTQLTNELVELAREDPGPVPVEAVDLSEVVAAAVERVRARGTGVVFATRLEPVTVAGRPAALERMVLNLLDNAAKWSPPGATVDVRLAGAAGTATLTVADAGPGIDREDLPRVFERFYRALAARSMPGSGLGLAIVAQTVEQHGGTVAAGRAATGGALLTVTLPTAAPGGPDSSDFLREPGGHP
ncbi:HAMP domain-containing sensor histidine kinase [Longispora urticae]